MRRALIGLILAATAMTPAAVQAQSDVDRQAVRERYERLGQENQQRYEARQQRQEARQQQVQQRREAQQQQAQQRREARQQQMQQRMEAQRAAQAQAQEHRRGQRGSDIDRGWQGDRTDPRMEEHRRRYMRLERENQRGYERDQAERADREERRQRWEERRRDRDRSDRGRDRWDRGGYGHGGWDRSWRHDRRYDWQRWRYSNRHHYRLPPYYAPHRGHRYSRFGIGIHIGRPFYHQRYWIQDPWHYRLPHAPAGYQWVRYYDDVLLIDTWSGEVVDVIYDFFW